jgi:hypothetical protein
MRTTLDVEPDVLRQLKELAHRTGRPLKGVVNAALRAGLAPSAVGAPRRRYRCPTFAMGRPLTPGGALDKALAVAVALEDADFGRFRHLRWVDPLRVC